MKRKIGFVRQLAYVLETICVVPPGILLSLLPWKMGTVLVQLVGALAFHLNKKDKKWAYKNLDIIFADAPLSRKEKDRIVKRLFVGIGLGVFEYLKIGGLTESNYPEFVRIGNYEPLVRALAEKKGVVAVTAHFGNWEYLGSVVAKLGVNVATILKHQHNPYTDRWLRNIREQKGKVKCFYNEPSLLIHVANHLKRNGVVAILADQRDVSNPIFVPFFGVPSATSDGPARLHLWYEAPIVLCFSTRQNDGRYFLSVEGPYHFERTDDSRADCENIMTWIHQRFEEKIKKHPDQWFSILTPRWEAKPEDFENIG